MEGTLETELGHINEDDTEDSQRTGTDANNGQHKPSVSTLIATVTQKMARDDIGPMPRAHNDPQRTSQPRSNPIAHTSLKPYTKHSEPNKFREENLNMHINDTLNHLISSAKKSTTAADLDVLEKLDYENVKDPSSSRLLVELPQQGRILDIFMVELRGEHTTDEQLRDDLMILLIAGHETTAAVLT